MQVIGTVREIWRFPVKSMGGESLAAAQLTACGLLGDRQWATRNDSAGEIQGAKKMPLLMQCVARYRGAVGVDGLPPVDITLPDGSCTATDDAALGQKLSALLERPISLWPVQPASNLAHYRRRPMAPPDMGAEMAEIFQRLPDEPMPDFSIFAPELSQYTSMPGDYFDAFPLHLLTTASLAAMAARNPGAQWDARRFRPNLVIDPGSDAEGLVELGWVGRTVLVGGAEISCVTPAPRCGMTTRAQPGLANDPSVLRTIVADAAQNLGLYARVITAGEVRVGDPVLLS
ncbi:MAG: MOSC domain-containing protein [Pseudomonadales bacterium]